MTAPRLPRRRVTAYGERRRVVADGTRYGFTVDVLSCGHELFHDDRRPATRGCPHCHMGRPAGFYPFATYTREGVR